MTEQDVIDAVVATVVAHAKQLTWLTQEQVARYVHDEVRHAVPPHLEQWRREHAAEEAAAVYRQSLGGSCRVRREALHCDRPTLAFLAEVGEQFIGRLETNKQPHTAHVDIVMDTLTMLEHSDHPDGIIEAAHRLRQSIRVTDDEGSALQREHRIATYIQEIAALRAATHPTDEPEDIVPTPLHPDVPIEGYQRLLHAVFG